MTQARLAMDYPALPDDAVIIWSGNAHVWPDARRETSYLGHKTHLTKGFSLFTNYAEEALTFASKEDAQAFLAEQERLRPHPYSVTISTVAEMKVARGYEPAPSEGRDDPAPGL